MGVIKRRLLIAVILAVLASVAVVATVSALSSTSGGAITAVQVVRQGASSATTSQSWVALPSASTSVTVPSGQQALILARFSAESACTNQSGDPGSCNVRILIGGVEAAPASGADFAFDSNDYPGFDVREGHSMDRSRGPLGAGTYAVVVQYKVTAPAESFTLDDWSLTVERSQVG
jgi:hypothetical protein